MPGLLVSMDVMHTLFMIFVTPNHKKKTTDITITLLIK